MVYIYTRLSAGSTSNKLSLSDSFISKFQKIWHWLILAFTTLVFILIISILAATNGQLLNDGDGGSSTGSQNCGNSSDEARALGCQFDVMSFTWSQPSCFDNKLMDNFLSLKNWTWWHNPNDNIAEPVPFNEVSLGQHSLLYVTWEYHITHCTFMWKKMHHAIMSGRPLDSYVNDFKHTLHCEQTLLDREISLVARDIAIRIKFPYCPKNVKGWNR